MSAYPLVLFLHLLCLVLAVVGASLAAFAALRLRAATTAGEAAEWLALTRRVARLFPVSTIGLLATGRYMATGISGWSHPGSWLR